MEPLGTLLVSATLGGLLAALAYGLEPRADRRPRLLLVGSLLVGAAFLSGTTAFSLDAQRGSCGGGLECLGPSLSATFAMLNAWAAAVGFAAPGLAALVLGWRSPTPGAITPSSAASPGSR